MAMPGEAPPEGLAEVKRVRQFFPETWIWRDITTDESGRAVVPVEAPDSITTWMLRAVGMSKEHGLGIGEGVRDEVFEYIEASDVDPSRKEIEEYVKGLFNKLIPMGVSRMYPNITSTSKEKTPLSMAPVSKSKRRRAISATPLAIRPMAVAKGASRRVM